jgi:hypothetical protein
MDCSDVENEPIVRARVQAGVCRFTCNISTYLVGNKVRCVFESDCPAVMKFEKALWDIEPTSALKMPYSENEIYEIAGKTLNHATCPLPAAVIKCVEIASGLALARDVRIEFSL